MAAEPHERLSQAMNDRRLDLRMRWTEIAAAAKISAEALRAIRRGSYRPSELTARRLDEVLGWTPGSVERILSGGRPRAIDRDHQETPEQRLDRLYREWKERDPEGLRERLEPGPSRQDTA